MQLPCPARFRRQVQRRVQRRADADGDVLRADRLGILPTQLDVAQRADAQRLGPLGEGAGREARAGVLAEAVPGVGRDGDGYAVRRLLRHPLDRVVPAGGLTGRPELVDVEVVDALVDHDVSGAGLADRPRPVEHAALEAAGAPVRRIGQLSTYDESGELPPLPESALRGPGSEASPDDADA